MYYMFPQADWNQLHNCRDFDSALDTIYSIFYAVFDKIVALMRKLVG